MSSFLKICRTGTMEELSNELSASPDHMRIRSKADETGLHVVISVNPAPALPTKLLLSTGYDPNCRGYRTENKTPLHIAARRGCVETVKVLLAFDARVDAMKRGDWTPLMIACCYNVDVVRVLLDAGADVNIVNRLGETCIHLAARSNIDCLRTCINAGARINARTRNGRSCLHYAARASRRDCMKLLLDAGCEKMWLDHAGLNCAHEAVLGGSVECLELVKDVAWRPDCAGLNCLHYAAIHGHKDVVKALLDVGTREMVDQVDHRGFSARRLALCNGHYEIVELLEEHGVDETDVPA